MKLWKHSGTYLTATGFIHTIVGLIMGQETYWAMLKDGLINSTMNDAREFGLWFLVCGLFLILFGTTLQHYIRVTEKPAPRFVGWFILILSLAGGCIVPLSGFWLFVPQAIIILLANKKHIVS